MIWLPRWLSYVLMVALTVGVYTLAWSFYPGKDWLAPEEE